MTTTTPEHPLEERIATLEHQLSETIDAIDLDARRFEARLRRVELVSSEDSRYSDPVCPPAAPAPSTSEEIAGSAPMPAYPPAAPLARSPREAAERAGMSIGDIVGGRVLAWLGGMATLAGIVLFLAMAISHDWIDEETRVVLAAAGSLGLMAGGVWLHDRRGRTEAAVAMVGAATAALFATLLVASDGYHLLPGSLAVLGSLTVGATATALAIRWAGRAIGGLGLLGALLCGLLVGGPPDSATVAMAAVAGGCAMTVVVWQRWGWLALGAVLLCAPQWVPWVWEGQSATVELLVLCAFAALGLFGAIAVQLRSPGERLVRSSAVVMGVSACIAAVVGHSALSDAAGETAGNLWLAALACAHLVAGSRRFAGARISSPMRQLLIAMGVALADVAFGLSAHGITLAAGWGLSAVAIASLGRRSSQEQSNGALVELGVGTQIALTLIRALIETPPSALAGDHAQLVGLLSLSMLAASCLACAHLASPAHASWRRVVNGLGLTAIAYLTASALDGAVLAAAWSCEGLALARMRSRTDDLLAGPAALAFLGAAALHVLAFDAPPSALVDGTPDLTSAAIGLGALAGVGLRVGLAEPSGTPRRHGPLLGTVAALLYLASIATITAFQPTATAVSETVLDLTVLQLGQVALSALWSVVGLGALILGLRRNIALVRTAGLVLLLAAVGKVFLYDLSTLTSIYRVASFIVLGLLLLAGAFAYQRLRPPPLPDMRAVHPSQR
jgi:uncharacterized membrane protein